MQIYFKIIPMKKTAGFVLVICMAVIIYYLIKEEVNGIVLSHKENILLSIIYILIGVCIFIFAAAKFSERKRNRLII